MQIGALIAMLRGVTLPVSASFSAVFEPQLARWCWARVAISAPISLTRTTEFLSLMNPLLSQMLGESASVEIQASAPNPKTDRHRHTGTMGLYCDVADDVLRNASWCERPAGESSDCSIRSEKH